MKILMTGGSGLLGKEILKLDSSISAPAHTELDVTDKSSIEKNIDKFKPDVFLHVAAKTKPPEHEENPEQGIEHNIVGTANVAQSCIKHNIRLVYTSSDYVYGGDGPHKEDEGLFVPSNFLSSKIGGECAVRVHKNSLILRLSFGPMPFSWEKVYENQYNSKLYVDEMAPLVLNATKSDEVGIMNIGGPRTSLFEYAKRTRPDIENIPKPDWVPHDTSLDLTKMMKVLGVENLEELIKHDNKK